VTISTCGCDETYCDKHFQEKSAKMRKVYDREKLSMRYCPDCSRPLTLTGFDRDKMAIWSCSYCSEHEIEDDAALMWSDVDPKRKRTDHPMAIGPRNTV
jgi:ribosomal protein L37AE/L43A